MRFERAEYSISLRPTGPEPVKAIMSTSIDSASASPATPPRPGMTLSTPAGSPASSANSPSFSAVSGDCSAGLRTTELPMARAGATFHIAMCSGKFHGTMAPITPSGSCTA